MKIDLPSLKFDPKESDKKMMDNCPFSGWIKLSILLHVSNLGLSASNLLTDDNNGLISTAILGSTTVFLLIYLIGK